MDTTVDEPIEVTNDTTLDITGSVNVDNVTYPTIRLIDVGDDSAITIAGGSVGYQFSPDPVTGIGLSEYSNGSMTSGSISGGSYGVQVINSDWNQTAGNIVAGFFLAARGLEASGNSNVSIAGGTIWANSDDAIGLVATDNTSVSLSGGVIEGQSVEPGADGATFSNDAELSMTGGQILGSTLADFGSTFGLVMSDNTATYMSGGTITSSTLDQLYADVVAVSANGNSYFELTGGLVEAHANSNDSNPDLYSTGILATDNAVVSICGGDINTTADLVANANDIVALDDSTIFVCASSVDFYELYEPITDFDGHISGISLDGRRFDYAFNRAEAATIMVVPEPQLGFWFVAVLFPAWRRRVRQR